MTKLQRRQLPGDSLAALAELARILGGPQSEIGKLIDEERAQKKPRPPARIRKRPAVRSAPKRLSVAKK